MLYSIAVGNKNIWGVCPIRFINFNRLHHFSQYAIPVASMYITLPASVLAHEMKGTQQAQYYRMSSAISFSK